MNAVCVTWLADIQIESRHQTSTQLQRNDRQNYSLTHNHHYHRLSVCLLWVATQALHASSNDFSRPNKVGLKCPSVCPCVRLSTKSFFDFNDSWYVGRGQWVIRDGVQYDTIQGQGHESLKVGNSAIFKRYLLPHL